MRGITSATIIVMLFSFAFVSAPVLADCAADIEIVEEEINSNIISKHEKGKAQAARQIVKKAKAALAEGKKKKCEKLIKKAQDTLADS